MALPRGASRRVLLWDIDGTLVNLRRSGTSRHCAAVELVVGASPSLPPQSWSGATDLEILTSLLQEMGVAPTRHAVASSVSHLNRLTTQDLREFPARPTPGAVPALTYLSDSGWINGIVTGNTKMRGEAKLRSAGIPSQLITGPCFFGDRAPSRSELLSEVVRKVRPRNLDAVVVVGDTPVDVRAALNVGLPAVGVATGAYGVPELREAGAHLAISGLLQDLPTMAEYLTGLSDSNSSGSR